jgi:hypothetical protein
MGVALAITPDSQPLGPVFTITWADRRASTSAPGESGSGASSGNRYDRYSRRMRGEAEGSPPPVLVQYDTARTTASGSDGEVGCPDGSRYSRVALMARSADPGSEA